MAGLMQTVKWLSEARAEKEIGVAMSFYKVQGGEIRATNGHLTGGCPWNDDAEFLVAGTELEKILARMGDEDPTVTVDSEAATVNIRSGRFHGTVATLPIDTWMYPGVENANWQPIPDGFLDILRSLRAFIGDKPAQMWLGCVALENGNCYASNNISVAGSACDIGEVQALLPAHAIDFLLRRTEGLESWTHCEEYVGFRWASGQWMRSQLVIGKFPERAAELIRDAYNLQPTQEITDDFREAFADVAALAEDTMRIYADRMESKFKKSVIVAPAECEVPPDAECSIWGAAFLAPVISQATHWQPSMWPKPTAFRGESIAGFIVGRKSE